MLIGCAFCRKMGQQVIHGDMNLCSAGCIWALFTCRCHNVERGMYAHMYFVNCLEVQVYN